MIVGARHRVRYANRCIAHCVLDQLQQTAGPVSQLRGDVVTPQRMGVDGM